ncbi:MAG: dihydrodipicolinate reductase [Desulfobacterales bacterium]|nr:dihydrodipicolinate reductase [Desulfobacterales bacterium]
MKTPIKIMMNGLPGNVVSIITGHALKDDRVKVLPYSLTGPDIEETEITVEDLTINLILPENRDQAIKKIKGKEGDFICVDYTHPSAVNSNAEFYCANKIPFVMGTTGGDRDKLNQSVCDSDIPAVIAPNMAKQIVGFQAMMAFAAENFPDLFKGYSLEIKESHQKGKADTSGTAKAMVGYFNNLGIEFTKDDIIMERDPEHQKNNWDIPEAYLGGHAWHTYTLVSPDKTATFSFTHNINGRDIYAQGTLDAIEYLGNKIQAGEKGKVFTMIDVLKGI